ncbi:hypothetical protein FNV43_RR00156 [Rhamnella rubrinervis]|uniref:Uncharacterized protein n=1 Tax=Rhamnella rubrinervis TaxID=2594499 RepID=A0A8K0MS48_9ROSA|nr:hypothetical protein FNV43_RR00156 [Rhamnella rubrinervis]
MCVFNYTISVLMDPGRVLAPYMPDIEDYESPVHEIKRKGVVKFISIKQMERWKKTSNKKNFVIDEVQMITWFSSNK